MIEDTYIASGGGSFHGSMGGSAVLADGMQSYARRMGVQGSMKQELLATQIWLTRAPLRHRTNLQRREARPLRKSLGAQQVGKVADCFQVDSSCL